MAVSIVIACYNGEKYLNAQLDSIVSQIDKDDEIIVSVDPSNDHTMDILKTYQDKYPLKIYQGPGKGVIKNFENALEHVHNDIIFLSDQDDIWLPNKVERVLASFDDDTMVILHDCIVVDEKLNVLEKSFFKLRGSSLGIMHNIIKNSYMGCCMALRKTVIDHALPFDDIPMHDQYLGLIGEKLGKNKLIYEPLIYYRRHEDNVSKMKHSGMLQMILWRIKLIEALNKL